MWEAHELVFTPTPTVPVIVKSFNFHPYYNNGRDYAYDWSVSNLESGERSRKQFRYGAGRAG